MVADIDHSHDIDGRMQISAGGIVGSSVGELSSLQAIRIPLRILDHLADRSNDCVPRVLFSMG